MVLVMALTTHQVGPRFEFHLGTNNKFETADFVIQIHAAWAVIEVVLVPTTCTYTSGHPWIAARISSVLDVTARSC